MFDNYDKVKLEELRNQNEQFYVLAVRALSSKNSVITPFLVKEIMIELNSLCNNEELKEIIESDDPEHTALIMLQTGDVTIGDLKELIGLGVLSERGLDRTNEGETKHFAKDNSLELKAQIISIKDKEIEEKLALLIKSGVYSKVEIQKMMDNGLIDKEKLNDFLKLHGVERKSTKHLASAFEPLMSFDGVRLSNDIVIGGTNEEPTKADEMANKQIYIF